MFQLKLPVKISKVIHSINRQIRAAWFLYLKNRIFANFSLFKLCPDKKTSEAHI